MPYYLAERVNLRFTGDPMTAELTLSDGRMFTVESGGIEVKRDGGLVCEFDLPDTPGDVTYEFTDGKGAFERGTLRVIGHPRPAARLDGYVDPTRPGRAADGSRLN